MNVVLFRYAHGALSVTGWGWVFALIVASTASSTITNHWHRARGRLGAEDE